VVTLKGGGTFLVRSWTGSGSFYDANPGDTFTAVVHYGDGSGAKQLTLSGNHFTLSHTFPNPGLSHEYTVTVTVTDVTEGVSGSSSESVTILVGL
jgi:hypothetical protein